MQQADVTDEQAIVDRLSKLHPAVVSDILDTLGLREQVMDPRVRPLYPEARVAGVARTVLAQPASVRPERREDQYRKQLEAIEALTPGSVMVVSTVEACYWGELLSVAARHRGAHGIVIDGYTRDTRGIIELQFPTFVTGIHAGDALGRIEVVDYGCPITSGGVPIEDGDLLIGDYDGIVVIPRAHAEAVVEQAEEKVSGENVVRAELERGMPVSEAFMRYGIL